MYKTNKTILLKLYILAGLVFLFFYGCSEKKLDVNTYLKTLPNKYKDIIEKHKGDSSVFIVGTLQKDFDRELVVLKKWPTEQEEKLNFDVEVYEKDGKKLNFKIEDDVILYNHHNVTYGLFKKALPFIEINKIVIKQKQKKWKDTIYNPFPQKSETFSIKIKVQKQKANPYHTFISRFLEKYNVSFIPYTYIEENNALYQTNEIFDDFFKTNNFAIGIVKSPEHFWRLINRKDTTLTKQIIFEGNNKTKAGLLLKQFIKGEKEFSEIFDTEKLSNYFAILDMFTDGKQNTLYFIYNKETNLLEPMFVFSDNLGKIPAFLTPPPIKNVNFKEKYIKSLEEISQEETLKKVLKNADAIQEELVLINSYDPKEIFDIDNIKLHQKIIEKALNAEKELVSDLISIDSKKIKLLVHNLSTFPLSIKSLKYKKKKISKINHIIPVKYKETLIIDLPAHFENLFVNKKGKETGFKIYKHVYDMHLNYSIIGTQKTYHSSISPYTQNVKLDKEDLMRKKSTLENFKDISVDEKHKIITLTKDKMTINTPLIIPDNYTFELHEGAIIDIVEGGKIISYSPLRFIGIKDNPIRIISSDEKGQGIIVLSDGKESELEYVVFDHLTNLEHGYWSVSGAVNFYESPVKLNHVTVSNNTCEDAVNIVRTKFVMNNCTIANTQSDAFDGDFVTGTVLNSKFVSPGNDAIDVSGSDVIVDNVQITKAGDKGISAGENSKMNMKNIAISDSQIAVASKDFSKVNIDHITIKNTKLGFTAFQKKPEFGPSVINVKNVTFENVETKFLIERGSSLTIDGRKIKINTIDNVKAKMYGVEFGVSSKTTRQKKKQK